MIRSLKKENEELHSSDEAIKLNCVKLRAYLKRRNIHFEERFNSGTTIIEILKTSNTSQKNQYSEAVLSTVANSNIPTEIAGSFG